MDLVRTSAPGVPLLTTAEAKAHLRLDADDTAEDAYVDGLVAAATAYLDGPAGVLGRCLVNQTWKVRYDQCFPGWRIQLPLAPLVGVGSIEYVDADGVTQTLSSSVYQVLDGPEAAVQPAYGQAWPSPRGQARAVTITFTAGYGAAASAVPAAILAAAKMLVGELYETRESAPAAADMRSSPTVDRLLAPFRARSVA